MNKLSNVIKSEKTEHPKKSCTQFSHHSIANQIYKPSNSSPVVHNSNGKYSDNSYQFNYQAMYQNWYPTPYNYQNSIYSNSYPSQYANFDQASNPQYYYQPKFDPFYNQHGKSFLPQQCHSQSGPSLSNLNYQDFQESSNYTVSKSNHKREAERDENDEEYTSQPSKRFNSQSSSNVFLNNLQLPISPVNFPSIIQPKVEYNDQSSDESLNSTDYLSYMNSLSTHSTISSESVPINGIWNHGTKSYLPCLPSNESGY